MTCGDKEEKTQDTICSKASRLEEVQCVQGIGSRLGWMQQGKRRVTESVVRWRNYGSYNFPFKYDENLSYKSTVFSEHSRELFFISQNLIIRFNGRMPWIVLIFCFSFFIFNQIRLHLFELASEVKINHLGNPVLYLHDSVSFGMSFYHCNTDFYNYCCINTFWLTFVFIVKAHWRY